MDFEIMDERGYRSLNSDLYSERRSLVLDLAENLPEDATEEQMRAIDAELCIIKDEDARRDALVEVRNHKALEVIGGAGEVIEIAEEEDVKEERSMGTLGEFAVENLDLTAMRNGMSKSAGTDFLYRAYNDPHKSTPIEVLDQRVVDTVMRRLDIRNLFGAESISGTSLKYFVLGATEAADGGAPKAVAEAAQKPQFHIPYAAKTVSLQKIAGWFWETDELIEDNAFLKSAIDQRGLYELDKAVEAYLLSQLLGTTGIGTASGALTADTVFAAIMKVKNDSDYDADAIVINPNDYQTLRLAKDGNPGQYYGGGCFYGPYGNGAVVKQPGLWGVNTVISNSVSEGTILVGAFKQGASVITKAGEGSRIEVVTGDHDDRTNNRVTVIVEERLALAARVPSAFVVVSTDES